jgi:methionyl-tRNA formyltransferase
MLSRHPGIRGGVPGSDPIWGDYLYMALPSWGAKFLIDALLAKHGVLSRLHNRRRTDWTIPADDVSRDLPHETATPLARALRVVLYTAAGSTKVAQMVQSWSSWGFRPAAVVLERRPAPSLSRRLRASIRDHGIKGTLSRLLRRRRTRVRPPSAGSTPGVLQDAESFCMERGIRLVVIDDLGSARAIETIRTLEPDLAVHAGAGILRAPLLAVPRLGTLNAHMGILPRYRGMNVAEWARFEGGPVGCSVHLIAPGIDTGDIICVRPVNVDDLASISAVRERVDHAQIALLGEVMRFTLATGCLPACRPQPLDQGVQFFRMHPELAARLEAELRPAVTVHSGIALETP